MKTITETLAIYFFMDNIQTILVLRD